MKKILRGAMVGCGYASSLQLRAWTGVGGVEIVAVSSLDVADAQSRAKEFGIANAYESYEEMLDSEDIDFVDIATPPESHLELIAAAAKRRLAILCQKPIASSLKELDQMIELCEKKRVRFMVNENGRFQPWFRKIKGLILDGAIGDPFYAKFESRSRVSLSEAGFSRSFFHEMPRLITYELGVHFLDTARYLFGEVNHIYAQMNRIGSTLKGEDVACLMLKQGRLTSLVDMSWASEPSFDEKAAVSWCRCRIEGDRGTIDLKEDGKLILKSESSVREFPFGDDSELLGYRGALQHFVYGLHSGATFETEGDETRKTMELVFGAYDSARNADVYHVGKGIGQLV